MCDRGEVWIVKGNMTATATPDNGTSALLELTRWLDSEGMSWRVVRHRGAASAAAEAVALSRPAELVAKTIVLNDRGRLVAVVIPASERLSPAKLGRVMGSDEVVLACEDEIVLAAPAYELGALPPCGPGLPPVEVVDRRLLTYGRVLCAAGDRSASLAIDPEELVRVTGATVADISASA